MLTFRVRFGDRQRAAERGERVSELFVVKQTTMRGAGGGREHANAKVALS